MATTYDITISLFGANSNKTKTHQAVASLLNQNIVLDPKPHCFQIFSFDNSQIVNLKQLQNVIKQQRLHGVVVEAISNTPRTITKSIVSANQIITHSTSFEFGSDNWLNFVANNHLPIDEAKQSLEEQYAVYENNIEAFWDYCVAQITPARAQLFNNKYKAPKPKHGPKI